MAKENPQV
jgi:hypothetical protein